MKTYGRSRSLKRKSLSNPISSRLGKSLKRRSISSPSEADCGDSKTPNFEGESTSSFSDPYGFASDPYDTTTNSTTEVKVSSSINKQRKPKLQRSPSYGSSKSDAFEFTTEPCEPTPSQPRGKFSYVTRKPKIERSRSDASVDVEPSHEDRVKLDELEYLIDGLKESQSLTVRQVNGKELASVLKKGEALVQMRYLGCHRIFENFQNIDDEALGLTCGVIGCLVAQEAAKTKIELMHSFVRAMSNLFQFKKSLRERESSVTSVGSPTTSRNSKRRRRISRKSSSRINRTVLCQEIISYLDWEKLGTEEQKKVCPCLLALRALSRGVENTKLRQILIIEHPDVLKFIVKEFVDEIGGEEKLVFEKLTHLVSLLELLTHEDSSEPIFINTVGEDLMSQLLERLGNVISAYRKESDRAEFTSSLALGSLRILVNLTNNQIVGSNMTLSLLPAVFGIVSDISCTNEYQSFSFDIGTTAMGILINCCERNHECCFKVAACSTLKKQNALLFLVDFFEKNRDREDIESQAFASYSAMLLGFLVQASDKFIKPVRNRIQDNSFQVLVQALRDFIVLQCKAKMITEDSLKSLVRVVDFLQKADSKSK
eukprot:jgi/Bigna1/66032/fgenesh1_pg.1_\